MQSTAKVMQIKSNAGMQVLQKMQSNAKVMQIEISQIMQKMQSNDLLKSNENNGDNAKVTAFMNATIIIPSGFRMGKDCPKVMTE
jgi:hypothetical protein